MHLGYHVKSVGSALDAHMFRTLEASRKTMVYDVCLGLKRMQHNGLGGYSWGLWAIVLRTFREGP